jgi:hypothetical protein
MASQRPVIGLLVLLGLAAAACAIPGTNAAEPPTGGGEVVAGTGISLPPAWTDTPSPTVAPPTLTPTPTPPFGLAWATPVPVDASYDGWVRLESKRAALWLPPDFEVMDLGGLGDVMALMVYSLTEVMGQMAGELAVQPGTPVAGQPTPTLISLEELQETIVFDFVVAGSTSGEAALFMVGDPPKEGVDLGTAIEGALDSMEGEHSVETQHAISDRPYPMARLIVSSIDAKGGRVSKQLVYVFVIDGRSWSLTYVAPADGFEELLPLFEQSAASFELTG